MIVWDVDSSVDEQELCAVGPTVSSHDFHMQDQVS